MNEARTNAMSALYRDGRTLQEISAIYGVTRERVRQIIRKAGVKAVDGGDSLRARRVKAVRDAARNARCLKNKGCTWDQYCSLRAMFKPTRAFSTQLSNAGHRGIGWDLTLWQWWTIWQESGHWEQRGRGQGYVMCRKGDVGPYAVGNVFIGLATENCSERPQKKSGLPIGVSCVRGRYHAHRCLNGIQLYLGAHSTPEQAHAAYLAAPSKEQRAA